MNINFSGWKELSFGSIWPEQGLQDSDSVSHFLLPHAWKHTFRNKQALKHLILLFILDLYLHEEVITMV